MASSDPPSVPPSSVLIIGGSLAGLMHALTLLSLPNPPESIRILERSPTNLLHNQGAGVVAGPEVQEFFDKYVRADREMSVASSTRQYLDRQGNVMPESVEHRTQRMTSWDLLYHLLRWRVDGLQSEYVTGLRADGRPRATYENGCTVTAVQHIGRYGGGVEVNYLQDNQTKTAVADLVIAADGASSTVRRLVQHPDHRTERTYAGYVAWRGTVPETALSATATETFVEKFTFYHSSGQQILGYLIPGPGGGLAKGERLFNWVWYCNYAEGSQELEDLMTDRQGKRHGITLPVGGMREEVWEKQKAHAAAVLPPQYAEAVSKTTQPFVQAITDNVAPANVYMEGRVVLVGDALAGFRPHTAASTGQAAFDALRLGEWMRGEIEGREYGGRVMEFARAVQRKGVELGERSQFGRHPLDGGP